MISNVILYRISKQGCVYKFGDESAAQLQPKSLQTEKLFI